MWTTTMVFVAGMFVGVLIGVFAFALINAGRSAPHVTPPGPERLWRAMQ